MADEKKSESSSEQSETITSKSGEKSKNVVKNGEIKVAIEPTEPKNFNPKLSDLQDKAMNLSRMSEQGIINEKTGSAVVVREDGQINLSTSKYSQFKLSPNGRTQSISLENVVTTNRQKFSTDEFIINEHKMNPQLWEYTDFRKSELLTNQNAIVGNLCMMGSVLVKAWEPNLKRYVMIRRPWRGPIFGSQLNVPDILTSLKVNDPLKLNENILALSDKGYQVNGIIRDAKSLIGKNGEDRPGIIRNQDAMAGVASGSSSGGWDGSVTKITAADQLEFMHKFGEACVKVFKKEHWVLPASVCVSQACIESGYGSSARAAQDQNYLGIGVYSDSSVGGQYNGVENCIWTWGNMMARSDGYYTQAYNQYQSDHDPVAFIASIAGTYAADVDYTSKVTSVIEGNPFLKDYDKQIYS